MKYLPPLLLLVGSSVLLSASPATFEMAHGIVFHDQNENGRYEGDEARLAEVLVSNGRQVVKTDQDGAWTLPVDQDDILFVLKPRHYHPPVDAVNRPQFYYIHKPQGSPPELKFPGVTPTGPLPERIQFGLIKREEPAVFSALIFGDPQPYTQQEVNWFEADIIDELVGLDADYAFVSSLGDIVGDDLDLFAPVSKAVSRLGVPAWYVYGNHDMNYDVEYGDHADETFERFFGPANYAYFYGEVCFIALDNVLYPRPDGKRGYIGGFTNEQFLFVENLLTYLSPETLIVIQTHIPLEIYQEGTERVTWRRQDRDRLFSLFQHHPRVLALSAHTHTQNHHFYGTEDGWPHDEHNHALHHYNVGTTSGSWWQGHLDERQIPITPMRDGTPNGYAFIHFDGNAYRVDYRAANAPSDETMHVHVPNFIRAQDRRRHLMVNIYNGTPRDTVEFRVQGLAQDWRELSREAIPDPEYAHLFYARDFATEKPTNRQLPHPQDSTHLWVGNLPRGMPVGVHVVEVRHTDFQGKVTVATRSFSVVE